MTTQRSVQSRFWTTQSLQGIGPPTRLFLLYAMTGPRSNILGFFKLSFDDCEDETELTREQIQNAIMVAEQRDFLRYDPATRFLWIVKRLEKEFPGGKLSPLQESGVGKILLDSPKCELSLALCERYIHFGEPFQTLYQTLCETLGQRPSQRLLQSHREQKAGSREPEARSRKPRAGSQKQEADVANFEKFWRRYPKKEGRGKAEDSWRRHAKGIPVDEILAGIERWERSRKWAEGFIPMPATWLGEKRWTDEPEEVSGDGNIRHPGVAAALRVAREVGSDQS